MATIEQLEDALRKADAAGNVDDARQLANAIRSMRKPAAPAKPDFSGVSGEVFGETPLGKGVVGPSLEQINAQNRATFDQDKFDAQQMALRKSAYDSAPAALRFAAGAGEPVGRLLRGTVGLFTNDADEWERQSRAYTDATINQDTTGKAGRFAGDVALTAAPMSKIGGLRGAIGTGAVYGGLQPTLDDESRLLNAGIGGAAGYVGNKLGDLLAASGKKAAQAISPEVRKLYEAAKARGIVLTPAQLSDSKALQFLQSQLSRLPIIGGTKKLEAQRDAFNRELAGTIGEDAAVVTPEVYARAKARQSAQFNDLTERNSLNVSPDLVRRLEAIRQEAGMAGDDAQKAVSNALDAFYRRLTGAAGGASDGSLSALLGGMPGRAYQALDSQMGQVTKQGTPAAHFVGQMRSAIRGAMDDSISPADSAAWKLLREQYGNRKTIRDLVAKGDGGPISPQALMGRVTANNAGKEAMASGGRGSLGELARIGQRIKEPPSSGTAERLGSMALGAGAITNLPLTLAGLLGGSAVKQGLDSPLLTRLLLSEGRGQARQAVAPIVRSGGVAAAPAVAPKKRRKDADKGK